ncbi:VOC family protein [Streptomyces sp. NBC_01463]
MTSRFTELTVDCHDPEILAAFWCEVLGFNVIDRSEDKVEISSWEPTVEDIQARQMPPTLHFIRVPEGRTVVKNRLHLDVSPIDCSTQDEVTRLLGLGATHADVGQGSDRSWVVMADPEGNEFCVVRTLAPAPAPAPQK